MKNFSNLKIALLIAVLPLCSFAQEVKTDEKPIEKEWYQKGSMYGKIFANFHTSGSEVGKFNAFEVQRAYLGYKIDINDRFSTNIKLDIGNPTDFKNSDDLVVGRRFAFFKNAYIQYKKDQFKLQFGIADAFQFKVQEKFWGYRYIYPSFMDVNKFGSSADIGLFASYKFNDWFSADYSINNGEGYGYIQEDDNLKNTLGLTLTPIKQLVLRAYGDMYAMGSDSTQYTIALFAGIQLNAFSIGIEFNDQVNNNLNKDHDIYGYSAYATYKFLKKYKAFGRYDHLTSNVLDPSLDPVPWHVSKDGDYIIGGIEYAPMKNINIALDYRYAMYAKDGIPDLSSIYINLQAKF